MARTVMIFSGGMGLGVYQAGAYSELHHREHLRPSWFAGSSIGAINAAVLASAPPARRAAALEELWQLDPKYNGHAWLPHGSTWEHAQNWASAIAARLCGIPGQFRPRLLELPRRTFCGFYDLSPLRSRLEKLVDFERVNAGDVRVTIAATNLVSGELVLFDTLRGDRIGMDHLMASCGFLPEFGPVEIDQKLLGDGGLSANAPIEALYLDESDDQSLTCFVVDLYARDGVRPSGLEDALARKNDLIFANQTWLRLVSLQRYQELRMRVAEPDRQERAASRKPKARTCILYLSYRPDPEEAGPERPFDYSARTLRRRWQAGALDMAEALRQLESHNDNNNQRVSLQAIRRTKSSTESADRSRTYDLARHR